MKKKTLWHVFVTLTLIFTEIFSPWSVSATSISSKADSIQKQVDTAIENGFDGIIVYVQKSNEAPELYSAGWKNRENKTPADPKSLFKIASISKLYMAAATAKLAHNHTISLDKTLAEYLPDLAERIEYADIITLRMMVQHRSGIPNFMDDPEYPWASPPKTNREALELVLDEPGDFEPNVSYHYSNTNYLLLGEILDNALGYSHHEYIKKEILEPLNLKNTYSLLSEVNMDDLTSGYSVGYEPDIKYNDFIVPGGSMVATIEDVGVFLRALNDGSLLTKEEQAIYSSIYIYDHTGLLPGYQSIARYHKDIDTVVIQFINTSGADSWMKSEVVYSKILKILRKTDSSE